MKTNVFFSEAQLAIIAFCAEECRRQGSGELSVGWMLNAYEHACFLEDRGGLLTEADVLDLARLIEPEKNAGGYRKVPVTFAGGSRVGWENIERQMPNLIAAQADIPPRDFYIELEKIHPLLDGNGRLGAILFNLLNGSLRAPVTPPEVDFGLTIS